MVRPFSSRGDNVINIFNEIIAIFIFISVYVINNQSFSELAIKVWGWFFIIPIIISLVATWVISLPDAIEEFKNSLIDLFKKKEKQAKNGPSNAQPAIKDNHAERKLKKKAEK